MSRLWAPLVLALTACGCGSSSGLHLENGGRTVAPASTPATSQPSGGQPLPRRVTAQVRLGGVPAITWDGDRTMWAAVWAGGPHLLGSLVPVDTETGRPGAALPLPPSPSPYLVAAGGGSVYAAAGRTVLRIDPGSGAVIQRRDLVAPVRALLLAAGSLWATVDLGPLVRFDPVTLRIRAASQVTASPDAITTLGRSVLVTDDQQRAVRRVGIRSGRVVRSTGIGTSSGGAPSQITVYDGSIWIYEGATVLQVALRGLTPRDSVAIPSGGGSIAAGTGGVWVSGGFGVARIDPASATLDSPIAIGSAGSAIATTGNAVWVVVRRDGTLLQLER